MARAEGVDPSAVSRRVAALEAALDLSLFERTTRRLSLTEAGRVYLDRIDPLLDALLEAADVARDTVTEPSGLLRVTTSVAFGERWLTPRLGAFRAAYPRVDIELILSDARIDIAAEGIDLGLRLGPGVEGAFVVSKLFDVRYRVVASPSYIERMGRPSAPSDLASHDAVLFALPRFRAVWRLRASPEVAPIEVTPRPSLSISSALAIRRAVLEGLGVALLADWTVAEDLAIGRLIELFPNHEGSATDFDTSVWMLYPTRSHLPVRLRAFMDHLRRTA